LELTVSRSSYQFVQQKLVLALVHACIHTSHAIVMYVVVKAAAAAAAAAAADAADACVNGQCFKAIATCNAYVLMCLQASWR